MDPSYSYHWSIKNIQFTLQPYYEDISTIFPPHQATDQFYQKAFTRSTTASMKKWPKTIIHMHICMYYSSRDILLLERCNNSTDIVTHHQSTTCHSFSHIANVGIKKFLLDLAIATTISNDKGVNLLNQFLV